MQYSQDPSVLNGLYGQTQPYLAGRKSAVGGPITPVVAIPHITSPGGRVLNSSYGDGPRITRIEGQGNGGNWLELTKESYNQIMSGPPWKVLHPTYKNGRGPVDIKVIDPFKVPQGEFTLKFNVQNDSIDKATWTLINNQTGEQFHSDTSIVIANEQLFLDLGISITVKQVKLPGYDREANNGLIMSSISYADSSKRWLGGVPNIDGRGAFNWIRSGTLVDSDVPANNDYDYFGVGSGEGLDDTEVFEKLIGGTWAPYRMTSRYANGPMLQTAYTQNRIGNIASVDIVLTPDKSKWTRSPVLEMGSEVLLNEGGARRFDLRRGASVDKDGKPDGTGTGMGWFPGYAINIETGERLNIMFGEDSRLMSENGRDMMFNPTSSYLTNVGNMMYAYGQYDAAASEVLFGGKHYIYIMGSNKATPQFCPSYDEGQWIYNKLYYPVGGTLTPTDQMMVFRDIMYTSKPLAIPGEKWLSNEVRIKIRVKKPYAQNYSTYGAANPLNNNYPLYTFSLDDLAPEFNNVEVAKDALDLINVVPNPYYAYSAYERNQLDNRVKITNLPQKCTVSIYTVSGTLVRQYSKDEEKTSIDWDLKNHAGIPIAGGVYLIHVKADGIGEKVIKWFGILRPTDLQSF